MGTPDIPDISHVSFLQISQVEGLQRGISSQINKQLNYKTMDLTQASYHYYNNPKNLKYILERIVQGKKLYNLVDVMGILKLKREDVQSIQGLKDIFIQHVLDQKIVDTNELLRMYEKRGNFNYLYFIEKYGLPEEITIFGLKLIERKLGIEVTKNNRSQLIKNLEIFLKVMVEVESSGNNITNTWSGAEGYFQYMANNGKIDENGKWLTSSYQTALKRSKKYINQFNDNETEYLNLIKSELRLDPDEQDPKKLSAMNQTKLFLVDIICNGKLINNSPSIVYFRPIFLKMDMKAVKKIYDSVHHTNPDSDVYENFHNAVISMLPK